LGLVGSWFAGKASGGGGIEIGTVKKDEKTINMIAPFSPFIYQPTTDTSYTTTNMIDSPYSTILTKKETAGAEAPMSQSLVPVQAGGSMPSNSGGGGGGTDLLSPLLIIGLGVGAYFIFVKKGSKK
jgi:hypothetical protein